MNNAHDILGRKDEQGEQAAPEGQASRRRAFLSNLVRELFQTEQSAKAHGQVEAERLAGASPARALRAVSVHAERVLAELPSIMRGRGLPVSEGGRAVGKVFSALRDRLLDLMLSEEKSYRGTLLGMRHGIDLVELIRHAALADGDALLGAWCARWLAVRRPLVEAVAGELAWLAAHPERAMAAVKNNPVANAVQAILNGFEHLANSLGRRGPA